MDNKKLFRESENILCRECFKTIKKVYCMQFVVSNNENYVLVIFVNTAYLSV